MLLGTYTTENASQAREEAQRCIVASLADPQTFLLDHLLQLKPVKFLEGELIHDLLKVRGCCSFLTASLILNALLVPIPFTIFPYRSLCQRSLMRTRGFTTAIEVLSTA